MENEDYKTSDLALAATLALWLPIQEIKADIDNPKRYYFYFANNPQIVELEKAYWAKKLVVEPQLYYDQLRTLKGRIYERQRSI